MSIHTRIRLGGLVGLGGGQTINNTPHPKVRILGWLHHHQNEGRRKLAARGLLATLTLAFFSPPRWVVRSTPRANVRLGGRIDASIK
jgi:hypothetical protein